MYSSMNELPVGTPEQAGLMSIGNANFQQNMKDPAKNKLMGAMMGQALQKLAGGFTNQPMPSHAPRFDMYGNPLG